MSWLLKSIGQTIDGIKNRRNATPKVTSATSEKMKEIERMERKAGSLVLTADDVEALGLQTKVSETKKLIEVQRSQHQAELKELRERKQSLLQQIDEKLRTPGEDSVYGEIIKKMTLEGDLKLATDDGAKEIELLKQIHISEVFEKQRTRFQQHASDELIEVYSILPKFKERMGEREAKIVSVVFQLDSLNNQRKELYETILQIQVNMKNMLEGDHVKESSPQTPVNTPLAAKNESLEDDGQVERESVEENKAADIDDKQELSRSLGGSEENNAGDDCSNGDASGDSKSE